MKRKLQIITSASAASLLALTALAQETPNAKTRGTDITQEHSPSAMRAERLGRAEKASDLIGMEVKNLQDEKLGKVENLMVDLAAGRIVAVIVSSGGFLGLGDELSAIPPAALRFNTAKDTLQLDVSKEALSSAPHFKSKQWPDLGQPSYADGVYRAYRVEPYFSTNAVAATDHTARNIRDRGDKTLTSPDLCPAGVDNTARNVRDRNDRTLTPLDQGNSAADVDTTARIRKEIIGTKDMSVNARNVKIITANGRVTLRGPVNTAEEKRLIGEIAARIANADHVDNQLEAKTSATNRD